MNKKPNVLVLRSDGSNCDEEAVFAFRFTGANAKLVHVNELRTKSESLKNYQILVLPGGFSYGDDVASGKILAVELTSFFKDELQKFIDRPETLTIGICNGFQALVRTGLLPFRTLGRMQATLKNNNHHFECRWVRMRVEHNTNSVFLKNMKDHVITYQVAHGEGNFFADEATLREIERQNLVALRYVNEQNLPTQNYPDNPNGSIHAIAGITDPTGRIFGLMPHPERFIRWEQYPNWRRLPKRKADGLPIFEHMISYVKQA